MSSIYDAFDLILEYDDTNVIMFFDKYGKMWFSLRDIFKLLGYKNPKLATLRLDKKIKRKFEDIEGVSKMRPPPNFQKNTYFIDESGLYQLLSGSNKSISKHFRDEFFGKVAPQIRESGDFNVSKSEHIKLKKLNKKLDNLRQENRFLESKHTYQPSKNGYLYIAKTNGSIRGTTKTLYKIGITKNIKKRISSYKTGNPNFRLKYYIRTNLDIKQLESCIKNTAKFRSIKKNNETFHYEKLKDLKNNILRCSNILAEDICTCQNCKEKFAVFELDKHECKLKLSELRYVLAP